ncbi:MAG TPA: hypothetical protein VI341_11830 [Actinomycetota bacterium]
MITVVGIWGTAAVLSDPNPEAGLGAIFTLFFTGIGVALIAGAAYLVLASRSRRGPPPRPDA